MTRPTSSGTTTSVSVAKDSPGVAKDSLGGADGEEPGSDAYRTVLMSAPEAETARRITRALVEEGLAACGSVIPGVTSIYRWQGAIEETDEVLVVLKTTEERAQGLTERAVEIHPYEVPEVLCLPVASGHPEYLAWLTTETRRAKERP